MKKTVSLSKLVNKLDAELVDSLKESLIESEIDFDNCEVLRKSFEIDIEEKAQLDVGSRTAIKYVSTRTVDQTGDIILPKGVDLKLFKKTGMPVFYNHDYSKPQIGRAEEIKSDEWGVKAKVRYADTGEGTLADVLWKLTSQDMNKQSSVGIIPTEVIRKGDGNFDDAVKVLTKEYPELKKTKGSLNRIIAKCILFEFSDVSLACNTDTEVLAVSKAFQEAGADEKLLKQLGFHVEEVEEEDVIDEEATQKAAEEGCDTVVIKKKITLVKKPSIVKLVALPPAKIDKNEIKEAISAGIRKRLGRIV